MSESDQRDDVEVIRDGEEVPPALEGAVAAIGNFDGLHRGHRRLVETVREEAARRDRPAAILTFEPHPRSFFAPNRAMFRLTPEPVKLAILARLGIAAVFLRRFDAELASTHARAFVEDLLVRELKLSAVVIGHDFHFGKGREGTPALLSALCAEFGLGCTIVPAFAEGGAPVSASAVREALAAGEVERANRLLGYRFFVRGEVRHGDKRGRTLGFPTANLALGGDFHLAHGIYAVRAALGGGEIRDGVASFGRRPTFDDGAPLLETYLFDFAGDLYGRTIEVEFLRRIRGEERFASAEALVARMREDEREARTILAGADDQPPSLLR